MQKFYPDSHTPTNGALQNTSVITLLAFILSPETKSDHIALHETEARLRALPLSNTLTYNLLIANQLYELSFKVISNDERAGTLKQLEIPQRVSNKNKSLGEPSIIKSLETPIETNNENLPRILIVDDSEVNRDVVDIFLAPDFPTPLHAENGLDVLGILQCEQLDIILMDIHMPEMNGVDAL